MSRYVLEIVTVALLLPALVAYALLWGAVLDKLAYERRRQWRAAGRTK